MIVLRVDTKAAARGLNPQLGDNLGYLLKRLVTGGSVAPSALAHYGIVAEVEADMDQGEE